MEVFCVERPEMDGEMTVSHCKQVAVVSDHVFGTVMWDRRETTIACIYHVFRATQLCLVMNKRNFFKPKVDEYHE